MPWRGPAYPGEFPTLGFAVAEWIQAMCVVPDRAVAGQPLQLSDQQIGHLLWQYRLAPDATVDSDRPAAPFAYNGTLIVRPQKWGKGPFSAARICAQAVGPVLFAGWDADGEPVGRPWATPHIQVAAVAEAQTKNIWRVLKPMIELGPLADVITDTGLDRMNLAGGGIIEPVTSSALTRLGARISYVEIDQPESMWATNGGEALVDVLLRNLAGMGGRWAATGNAHDPTMRSVQQTWVEKPLPDVHIDWPKPLEGSWGNARDRRRILKHAYRGAPWVDIDRIEADAQRLAMKGDPGQAERFFGNRIVAGAAKAFDIDLFKSLRQEFTIEKRRKVTIGFDGSLTQDTTGLVVCDIETGHVDVIAYWARPLHLHEEDDWQVPVDELDEAVATAFDFWDVVLFYGDPPHYQSELNAWAGRYGDRKVVAWWTNNRRKMAYALRDFKTDMRPGVMSHSGHEMLVEHVANAVRRPTNIRDDEDGTYLWIIGKEGQKSPKKIDLAMCAVLAKTAQRDAVRAGALQTPDYGRAAW